MKAAPPGLAALLARLPIAEPARRALRQRLAEPGRHYHGAAHVALLWRRHRRFGAGSFLVRSPWDQMIACAIAFHDAVHDARLGDNEAASALLWRRCSGRLAARQRRWVEQTILATADHLGADALRGTRGHARLARAWLLDLDLTPLGEGPASSPPTPAGCAASSLIWGRTPGMLAGWPFWGAWRKRRSGSGPGFWRPDLMAGRAPIWRAPCRNCPG